MTIYLRDNFGVLAGPVTLPVIPGLGAQLPSNAVQLAEPLPDPNPGHAWALVAGEPQQLSDHRGKVYSTSNGAEHQHDALGELPPGLTKLPRPSAACLWSGEAWVKDCAYLHTAQTAEINRLCEANITGGFWSSALGESHLYASQFDDQLNLTGVILRGLDSPFACRDSQGRKAFLPHTFAQLRQVGDDFIFYKLQLLQKANQLKQSLDAALAKRDAEAIEAVAWEDLQE